MHQSSTAYAGELSKNVHLVNATSPDVLPILRAATHLFAYITVCSTSTLLYLAERVIANSDSNWLVYVTFDKTSGSQDANITVHNEKHRHDDQCTRDGVHWAGRTPSTPMSVSGQI